jgi:hypothetical protein
MGVADKHVFISYVREDSNHADTLCKMLTAAGIPFWRDKDSLAPGANWKSEIRKAIQSGSLVFLACFSTRSTARDSSYMNEEMNLAVDEFRRRPPGRTWLIPVRFDECDVPEWELDNRRTLHDLNWSDLFGPDHVSNAVGLVAAIKAVLGTTTDSAASVEAALEQVGDDERAEILYRRTKELLFDPTQRIVLDDMVAAEQRRILDAMRDETRFPVDALPGSTDGERAVALADTANDYWLLVEPLCWSLNVAARWGDSAQLARWIAAIRGLANEGETPRGGYSVLVELHRVPALVATVAAAVSAVAAQRWDNLKVLVDDPMVTNSNHEKVPLLEAVWPFGPFRSSSDIVPEVLARSATQSLDPAIVYADYTEGKVGKLYTPISDWLHHILRPIFRDQLPDDVEYNEQFDRAEAMLGALGLDHRMRFAETHETALPPRAHWFGRATWRARYGSDPAADLLSEVSASRGHWAPSTAGLFDGNSERAAAVLSQYRSEFEKVNHRW